MENIKIAFLLSTIAGLSTLLGTLIIFIKTKKQPLFITGALSFASGVMFTLSLLDLIPEGISFFSRTKIPIVSLIFTFIFTLGGVLIASILNYFLEDKKSKNVTDQSLYKLGLITMLAIIIHNIPEGIATFMTTTNNIRLGLTLTIAITLHNIPEGISIALPIYYSTKSKIKAISYTLISAISEPLGALIAFLFLKPSSTTFGIIFSIIAGIMIYISIFELLPTSLSYKKKKITTIFFLLGTILVLLNLFLI